MKPLAEQLATTIKDAMRTLPEGEHGHVAAIILQQNAEILRLSKALWQIAKDGGYRLSGYGAGSVAKEALGKQWDKAKRKAKVAK